MKYFSIAIALCAVLVFLGLVLNQFFLGYRSHKHTIEDIPSLFKNYYANWHSKTEHKAQVLAQIEELVKKYSLEKNKNLKPEELTLLENQTLQQIKRLSYSFSDYHVVLAVDPKVAEQSSFLKSQINIDFSTLTVNGSKILGIDGHTLSDWDLLTEKQNFPFVAYSTEAGRLYKKLKFLERFPTGQFEQSLIKTIQLEDKTNLVLKWRKSDFAEASDCIKLERTSENQVTLLITSFWCQSSKHKNRNEIINHFREQLIAALIQIRPQDQVTIDVSRNPGGGDEETDLVLSSLIQNKPDLQYYSYQFLKRTALIEHSSRQVFALLRSLFSFQSEWAQTLTYQIVWDKEISETYFIGQQIKEIKISPLCASACDLFILALKQNQNFNFVGQSTQGGLGLPIVYKINTRYSDHDVTLSLPSCRIYDGKMNLMEGVGVQFPK